MDIGGSGGEMKDHISVNGRDGMFTSYIARPKTSPVPAVVVLQELFGVNADIRRGGNPRPRADIRFLNRQLR